jgi:hypothetical protein
MPKKSLVKEEPELVVTQKEEELSVDEKLEMGSLVDRTLSKFYTTKHVIHPKAFNKLTERLMNSGKGDIVASSSGIINSKVKLDSTSVLDAKHKASHLYSSSDHADPLKKPQAAHVVKSLGKGWFDMEPMKLDEKLKRDLKIIQMRNYLDPKRFYKNPDRNGKILHVGTVIEGPSEYKSARLTNKERRGSLVEEILADSSIKEYTKRKFSDVQQKNAKKGNRSKVKKGKMGQNKTSKKLRMLY